MTFLVFGSATTIFLWSFVVFWGSLSYQKIIWVRSIHFLSFSPLFLLFFEGLCFQKYVLFSFQFFCLFVCLVQQWLPTKVQVQAPSPTQGLNIILFGGMFRSLKNVEVVAHGNDDVIFVVICTRAPTQE